MLQSHTNRESRTQPTTRNKIGKDCTQVARHMAQIDTCLRRTTSPRCRAVPLHYPFWHHPPHPKGPSDIQNSVGGLVSSWSSLEVVPRVQSVTTVICLMFKVWSWTSGSGRFCTPWVRESYWTWCFPNCGRMPSPMFPPKKCLCWWNSTWRRCRPPRGRTESRVGSSTNYDASYAAWASAV